jgi:hypothetical protein
MRIVVAKACLAKARRDATFQVVPGALCKAVEDAARQTAIGDSKTIEQRRKAVGEWISKTPVTEARVFAALGVKGYEDIGLNELETLTGLKTAIKDNDITIDEAFPEETPIEMPAPKAPEPPQVNPVDPDPTQDRAPESGPPLPATTEEPPEVKTPSREDLFNARQEEPH